MTAPEVNDLVEQWWPLARGQARKWGDRFPWLSDCFESAAAFTLWKLTRDHGHEERFPSLIRQAVRWAVWRVIQQERRQNPTAFGPQILVAGADGEVKSLLDQVADDEDLELAIESADELTVLIGRAKLSERESHVVRSHAIAGIDQTAIAEDLGVSHERVSQIYRRALRKLSRAARGEGRLKVPSQRIAQSS